MLILETIRRDLLRTPVVVKLGLLLMVFAGLADVIAHVGAVEHVGHLHQHTSFEAAAHLTGLVSMVVIFVGVVLDGVRQGRARRQPPAGAEQGVR
jgi:hypothetical protein